MARALILGAPAPFQGFVDAEDQGAVATIQVLEQQHQQDTGYLARGPYRPVEHLVVTGIVAVVAASHDAQRRGHGALARGQDRADQQQLGFLPSWAGEQRCEGKENGYNGTGQGEHGWTFPSEVGSGQLTLSLCLLKILRKA